VPIVILVLLALGIYLWYSQSRLLFQISVRNGRPRVTRGYAPGGLVSAFADVVSGVSHGEIRARRTPDGARLGTSGGIDERTAQRLRNVFSLYPVSQLTAPPVDAHRAAGSAFAISTLLALLRRRIR